MDSTLTTFWKNLTVSPADYLLNFGTRLLAAVIVLFLGMVVIKLLISIVSSTFKRTIHDTTVRQYSMSTVRITLWIILILIMLGLFGLETTSLVTLLGAAGLAIGLALQGTLSNFAAGFMLLLFRPFRSGDEIEVAGVTGTVIEISIFNTVIDMPDNIRAFVPNGTIFNGVIKNRSLNEYLRVELLVTVAAGTDITKVQQIMQRVMARNELVMEVPRPEVQVLQGDTPGITVAARPNTKLKNVDAVRTALMRDIRDELRAAGVEILK